MSQQLILSSLLTASIYSLIAVGFSLIFNVGKFINFSIGTLVTISGYLLNYFLTDKKSDLSFSIFLSIGLTGLIGLMLYFIFFQPFITKQSSPQILLVVSLSLMIVIESIIQIIFGPQIKTISLKENISNKLFGINISNIEIGILCSVFIIFGLIFLIFYKTRIGMLMRATSNNPNLAKSIGINTNGILATSFFFGSLLAGVGGVATALQFNMSTVIGSVYMLKAYTSSVIGGLTSIPATLIGASIIGLFENLTSFYLNPSYRDGVTYCILLLFLLFKPNGIWQQK
ncbi:MAG: branched-chain amino acid ABC transporter permease [Patescibacteria group bacterium]